MVVGMEWLNYHHLRYFWAVAHEGGLTRAAGRLNLSQSALSVQIQKLEHQVGHALFERVGKKLVLTEAGRAGLANPGAHGFSEVLYAFSSAANNNGSAFAGLSANSLFYNLSLAVAMALGRFGVIVPVLAIAGSLAAKKRLAVTEGTLPTHGPLFIVLLIGAVLLVGLLNYVPALALGPVAEHLSLWAH